MSTGWDLVETTGLLDDADCTIEKAYFGYDAGYQSGEVLLLIIEGSSPEAEDGEFRQFYSVGGGWETEDHGKTAEGGGEGFNKGSNYGLLIAAALATDAAKVLQKRGTPDNADIWEGLSFHMERQTIEREGISTSQVLLPTEFLGEGEVEKKGKEKKSKPKQDIGGVSKATRAKIKNLAKEHGDHDDFLEAVLDKFPEVEKDDEFYAEVMDEGDDGLWGSVQ